MARLGMNKEQKVLAHLQQKGDLTPLEALSLGFGMRLAAIVFRLKKKGHIIGTNIREAKDGTKYAEYQYLGMYNPTATFNG